MSSYKLFYNYEANIGNDENLISLNINNQIKSEQILENKINNLLKISGNDFLSEPEVF